MPTLKKIILFLIFTLLPPLLQVEGTQSVQIDERTEDDDTDYEEVEESPQNEDADYEDEEESTQDDDTDYEEEGETTQDDDTDYEEEGETTQDDDTDYEDEEETTQDDDADYEAVEETTQDDDADYEDEEETTQDDDADYEEEEETTQDDDTDYEEEEETTQDDDADYEDEEETTQDDNADYEGEEASPQNEGADDVEETTQDDAADYEDEEETTQDDNADYEDEGEPTQDDEADYEEERERPKDDDPHHKTEKEKRQKAPPGVTKKSPLKMRLLGHMKKYMKIWEYTTLLLLIGIFPTLSIMTSIYLFFNSSSWKIWFFASLGATKVLLHLTVALLVIIRGLLFFGYDFNMSSGLFGPHEEDRRIRLPFVLEWLSLLLCTVADFFLFKKPQLVRFTPWAPYIHLNDKGTIRLDLFTVLYTLVIFAGSLSGYYTPLKNYIIYRATAKRSQA